MLVQKNLSDLVTVARASTKMRVGSGGLLVSDAINVPSLAYDPITLKPIGFFMESNSTNLMLNSSNFGLTWAKGAAITITANAEIAPDGTNSASRVAINSAGSNAQFLRQGQAALGADSDYATSIFVKKDTYRYVSVRTAGAGISIQPTFDFDTGTWVNTGTPVHTCSAIQYPNGWWRLTAARLVTAAESTAGWQSGMGIPAPTGGETWVAAGGESVFAWHGQLEQRKWASSPIVTGAAQATRAIDTASINSLSSIAFNQSEGIFFFNGIVRIDQLLTSNRYLMSSDSGTNNSILGITSGNRIESWNGSIAISTTNAMVPGQPFKAAVSYNVAGRAVVVNGGAVKRDALLFQTIANRITLGGGTAGVLPDMFVGEVRYIPRAAVSDAELQALTAL